MMLLIWEQISCYIWVRTTSCFASEESRVIECVLIRATHFRYYYLLNYYYYYYYYYYDYYYYYY